METLAFIWSLGHFHAYLCARPFLWKTHQRALKFRSCLRITLTCPGRISHAHNCWPQLISLAHKWNTERTGDERRATCRNSMVLFLKRPCHPRWHVLNVSSPKCTLVLGIQCLGVARIPLRIEGELGESKLQCQTLCVTLFGCTRFIKRRICGNEHIIPYALCDSLYLLVCVLVVNPHRHDRDFNQAIGWTMLLFCALCRWRSWRDFRFIHVGPGLGLKAIISAHVLKRYVRIPSWPETGWTAPGLSRGPWPGTAKFPPWYLHRCW